MSTTVWTTHYQCLLFLPLHPAFMTLTRQLQVFHARLSFVAESIEVKAAILHSRSPSHCFSRVEDVDSSHPADILVASPPCLLYSKANRHSTYAEKMAEATRVVGELRRILDLLRPRLLVLEQTSSLVTHCPAAY